jgi:hypothetical protein
MFRVHGVGLVGQPALADDPDRLGDDLARPTRTATSRATRTDPADLAAQAFSRPPTPHRNSRAAPGQRVADQAARPARRLTQPPADEAGGKRLDKRPTRSSTTRRMTTGPIVKYNGRRAGLRNPHSHEVGES